MKKTEKTKAQLGAMSRNKGKRGELEVAKLLQAEGWLNASRGQQRSGLEQADVVGGPADLWLEVKRTGTGKLRPWPIGDDHHRTKITDATVTAMRDRYELQKWTMNQIADHYRVPFWTVRAILRYVRRNVQERIE